MSDLSNFSLHVKTSKHHFILHSVYSDPFAARRWPTLVLC